MNKNLSGEQAIVVTHENKLAKYDDELVSVHLTVHTAIIEFGKLSLGPGYTKH